LEHPRSVRAQCEVPFTLVRALRPSTRTRGGVGGSTSSIDVRIGSWDSTRSAHPDAQNNLDAVRFRILALLSVSG
jgi:hypothetical protein